MRAAALTGFAALCLVACLERPAVSADSLSEALARPPLDDLDASAVAAGLAEAARELAESSAEARSELDDPERKRWDFWPSRYPGLRMDLADASQRELTDTMLRLALSESGYRKLRLIQALEPFNPWSSPYYSALVFGEPSTDRGWAWRYQGHHMSVNLTMQPDGPILATPLFLGTQPLSHPSIAAGAAPLAAEETLARRLYQGLDAEQRQQATIERPPYTYLPERTSAAQRYRQAGVPRSRLSPPQIQLLDELIGAYADNVAPAIAAAWRASADAESGAIRFAWAGSDQPGRDHYYRIEGRDMVIEYDSRDGGSHIHSVWRSFRDDFGSDPLQAHYAATPHPPSAGW